MKSKTILIAYQDDLWARSLSAFFHGIGYRVETVKMISEMIQKIRNGNIHVILLDDEIEEVKAYDLVLLFKKINDKIQVIVISSEESLGRVKRLRGAGIFYQSMKPVDMEEVKSAVECAFEKIEKERLEGEFGMNLRKGRTWVDRFSGAIDEVEQSLYPLPFKPHPSRGFFYSKEPLFLEKI